MLGPIKKNIIMKKLSKIIIGGLFTLLLVSCVNVEEQAAKDLKKIELQVANDAIKQYEIAKRNGSDMDAYVQAGMVSVAFLQANDEGNYKKWKKIETEAGKKVGL
jgi:hypothetical protein